MKSKCVAGALMAGLALSAVAMAEPGVQQAGGSSVVALRSQPQFVTTTAVRAQMPKVYPIGREPGNGVRGPADPIIYDAITGCANITRIIVGGTPQDLRSPAAYFDDGAFLPETSGATVSSMDLTLWTLTATDPITFRVTFWDTIDPAADPVVQSTQLFTAEYQLVGTPVNTPGAWFFEIDTTGLVLPDDDWGVEIAVIDGPGGAIMPEALTGSVPVLPGAPCGDTHPVVGANAAIFWMDGDNYPVVPFGDGVRYERFIAETGEGDAFAFGAGGPMNGLSITLYGQPNIPPLPTGSCCIAGACVTRTADDCAAEGGTYGGDDTSCTGTWAYTAIAQNFPTIPDNDPVGVTDSLVISSGETITDLDVGLVIEHTWQGDLTITLTHVPSGTTAVLVDQPAFGNDHYGNILSFEPFILDDAAESAYAPPVIGRNQVVGRWKPDTGTLAVFNGLDSTGEWRLTVVDNAELDAGFMYEWGLSVNQPNDICPEGPAFCDADWCQDGEVGVPDIFCFLADWFASDEDAINYGGTPGVSAIFAFLAEWFATPLGTCP
jgi:subtilisin-like proprotein convertase family protein